MGVVVTGAEVTLADVLSLRIAIDEPLAEGTQLVLRHRGTGVEREVPLGTPGGTSGDASVAVSLAPLSLTTGRWDAYLQADATRTRIQSVDPGFSLDRLDAYALDRRTMAYRAYRTRNGFLAIKIEEAEPVADVRAVWFREGRFEVTGLLAYTGLDDDDRHHEARLALRHDDPAATVTVAATVQGVRFHAALSLCDVLDAIPESEGVWEPSLEVDGVDGVLPLGARLDDIEGKRRRVHYPQALVDGVPIVPSFTSDDELRLEVGA
ncbi:hypothetical protein GCM10023194_06500 [Planotetraspora phitsanulokensis]|uniref:Uncharacterized protein n=1 Tax=Planotetraspora phitsanulokensis TaxID=575192 RepID=A0A8J3U6R4_9ACTN|nr:hypothetical protein [Planotetraspora phitsanulokensis]GII39146.1 hypothetical protein Pph01_41490 [Planotetraspora phitsanulokensis]